MKLIVFLFMFQICAFARSSARSDGIELYLAKDGICERAIHEYADLDIYLRQDPEPTVLSHNILLRSTLLYCAPLAIKSGKGNSRYRDFMNNYYCKSSTWSELQSDSAKIRTSAIGTKWESQVHDDLRKSEEFRKKNIRNAKICDELDIPSFDHTSP